MKPTPHQAEKIDEIMAWTQTDDPFYILSGSAGVGKTFITKTVLSKYNQQSLVTATTNKAAQVISDMTGITACTIHSALSLKPKKYQGKIRLVQDKIDTPNLRGVRLVVVDESSMITTEVLDYIKKDWSKNRRKYLFIGDNCQLPPVGEDVPPVFEMMYSSPLTEIVRQAQGSPIIKLATEVRDVILGNSNNTNFTMNGENEQGIVKTLNSAEFMEAIYDADFGEEDCNHKILTFTNARSISYNKYVNSIYGIEDAPFGVGSVITFNEPYIKDDEIIANNGYQDTISGLLLAPSLTQPHLKYYEVMLKDHSHDKFKVIPEEYQDEWDDYFNELKQKAIKNPREWYNFYKAKEEFADIRPIFSSTVHKSQGSTYDKVFIDLEDLNKCRDYLTKMKLLYTAVTRASKEVYIKV